MQRLKIAQLILPWIPLPPPKYGGTERIVHTLTEGLVARGHEVTLFSVGETHTSAKLEYVFEKALGLQRDGYGYVKSSFNPWIHVAHCFQKAREFDIIHSHAQFLPLVFAPLVQTPTLHTFHINLHGLRDDERDILLRNNSLLYSSLSQSQKLPELNYVGTVFNAIDTESYTPNLNTQRHHLLWAGRFTEKKGAWEAVQAARQLDLPLILAGKITDPDYFSKIEPLIDGKKITYAGEVDQVAMAKLYQEATALLMPVNFQDPCPLVPMECMASGTPVVAYNLGALSEEIIEGKTGYVVPHGALDQLCKRVQHIWNMTTESYKTMRQACRKHAEKSFSIDRMVNEYEELYYKVLRSKN